MNYYKPVWIGTFLPPKKKNNNNKWRITVGKLYYTLYAGYNRQGINNTVENHGLPRQKRSRGEALE